MFNRFKKIFAVLAAAVLMCPALAACGKGSSADDRPVLHMWVLSEDYRTDILRATASAFTSIDWRLEVEVVGTSQLAALLEGGQADSASLPDLFMLPPEQLPAFCESEVTADLGQLGIYLDENRYYSYTIDAGTSADGQLKAACYEADPGLFFYRRSLAQYYLGTDDPDSVQDMLSDWQGFYDTAKLLYEASGGDTCMSVGVEELMMAYMADVSLVRDGKLYLGEQAEQFMSFCRTLASEGLIYNAQQWSDAWIAGMSDPQSVFGYFSSGLGMENILKPCCGGNIAGEGSYGDWAAIPGPAAYNWGGCWLAVHSASDMADEAAMLIEYFTCEETAMRADCLISGAFSANRTVVDQIKFDSQFSESFLSAQNCYSLMAQTADSISMGSLTPYDSVLRPVFAQCVSSYAFEEITLEQAVADFVRTVQAVYPELV